MATYVYDESNEQEKKQKRKRGLDAEVDVIKDSLKHHLNGLV